MGFISQPTPPLPRPVVLIVPFVPPVVPPTVSVKIEPSAHAGIRISNMRQEPEALAANPKPKNFTRASNPNLHDRQKGGASSITSESVTSEWITTVSLLTTCLHALIRRSPHNLRRLISTHRKHKIGPLLLPNSCYLRCDRCLPDRPPLTHTFTPSTPSVSPQATTQDSVIAF